MAHPPIRGHNCIFTRPLVHVGFLQSWLAGGFNEKVVNRVMGLVNSPKPGTRKLEIIVTGELLLNETHEGVSSTF